MLEWFMLLGIGFLSGCLLMVTCMPLVHGRAVRLTSRRLLAQMPLSIAEVQAKKDLQRAEFAMAVRRLEIVIEEMRERSALHLGEIGRKTAEIQRLKSELAKAAPPVASVTPVRPRPRIVLLKRA